MNQKNESKEAFGALNEKRDEFVNSTLSLKIMAEDLKKRHKTAVDNLNVITKELAENGISVNIQTSYDDYRNNGSYAVYETVQASLNIKL